MEDQPSRSGGRGTPRSLPDDIALLPWGASRLGISVSTAYRLAESGQMPGAFKIGSQWRISRPKFEREIHGTDPGPSAS